MEQLLNPANLPALITLVALEIVLGIDNIIFISILSSRLPKADQERARITGLGLAMITRIALLFSITLIMKLTFPLFTVLNNEISGRDLILLIGGLFLIGKSTHEIHNKLEGEEDTKSAGAKASFFSVIVQILILDIVFSLDSVITAVGMTSILSIMIAAVVISVIFMMLSSGKISSFINDRPTLKMLALAFLLLIGFTLVAEGLDQHIAKGYIYFSMAFSFFVEMLNLKLRKRAAAPIKLRGAVELGKG